MLDKLHDLIISHLQGSPDALIVTALIFAVIAISVVGYYITLGILKIIENIIGHTATTWDDDLLTPRILRAISQLTPALVVAMVMPRWFTLDSGGLNWIYLLTRFYIIGAGVRVIVILIQNFYDALAARPTLKVYAIKGVFQMLKIVTFAVGFIIAVSLLVGRSPLAIFTALGASAAVLMLVFKDTILGLVASVQLTANNMLQRGDWIICNGSDANGEVLDISLTTVKVKNWDNSVTTIPPYKLISDSFRNYEPMRDDKARRVSRSINIDLNTARFLEPAEIAHLRELGLLSDEEAADATGKGNLQLLRRYLTRWLREHPLVRHDLLLMVRQLQPDAQGLPIELYFFLSTTVWDEYEQTQADIFDHVFAVVNHFGLRIFQSPAGTDLSRAR